mmetsp:Transcript_25653/g.53782  ORF Transcript_25653/g.53782 Transcript_25653/m.53782 type:complete len:97 (+) Transcript_25653:81-371(+)
MKLQIAIIAIAIFSNAGQILAFKETSVGTRRLGQGNGPPEKVTICHYSEDDDAFVEITISSRAWSYGKGHGNGKHGDCEPGEGEICDSVEGCITPS